VTEAPFRPAGPLIPSVNNDKAISGVDADRDVEPRDGMAATSSGLSAHS
jgi:hypothetical protein